MLSDKSKVRLERMAKFLDKLPDKQFYMPWWGRRGRGCGTACCIAGWSPTVARSRAKLVWSGGETEYVRWPSGKRAPIVQFFRTWTGLSNTATLVNVIGWPVQFRRRPDGSVTNNPTAKQAAARIRHFIATDGRE